MDKELEALLIMVSTHARMALDATSRAVDSFTSIKDRDNAWRYFLEQMERSTIALAGIKCLCETRLKSMVAGQRDREPPPPADSAHNSGS